MCTTTNSWCAFKAVFEEHQKIYKFAKGTHLKDIN